MLFSIDPSDTKYNLFSVYRQQKVRCVTNNFCKGKKNFALGCKGTDSPGKKWADELVERVELHYHTIMKILVLRALSQILSHGAILSYR
jgi:hypothetical protein